MEYRFLGRSGLRVSVLALGGMGFGGVAHFAKVGTTGVEDAIRLVDVCVDAGVNLFDTADTYSMGVSEEVLGTAIRSRRDRVLVSTKCYARVGDGPNDVGASRHHIVTACEASLRRLGTDHIDLYHVHGFDSYTPLEETLRALDDLVRAGKVRYIGASNYSAWHLMKALAISDTRGFERFVALQAYYNLLARELEHEHLPLCLDQGVGVLVWSPLAAGFLTGKHRRGEPAAPGTRLGDIGSLGIGEFDEARGHDVVDALRAIAAERGVTVAQVALNWLLRKPGVTSVIVGSRSVEQLTDNLGSVQWTMSDEEVARLDTVSATPVPYPIWHQRTFNVERLAPLPPYT